MIYIFYLKPWVVNFLAMYPGMWPAGSEIVLRPPEALELIDELDEVDPFGDGWHYEIRDELDFVRQQLDA